MPQPFAYGKGFPQSSREVGKCVPAVAPQGSHNTQSLLQNYLDNLVNRDLCSSGGTGGPHETPTQPVSAPGALSFQLVRVSRLLSLKSS